MQKGLHCVAGGLCSAGAGGTGGQGPPSPPPPRRGGGGGGGLVDAELRSSPEHVAVSVRLEAGDSNAQIGGNLRSLRLIQVMVAVPFDLKGNQQAREREAHVGHGVGCEAERRAEERRHEQPPWQLAREEKLRRELHKLKPGKWGKVARGGGKE